MLTRSPLFNSPAMMLALIMTALLSLGIVMVYSSSGALAGLETRRTAAARAEMPVESFEFHHRPNYVRMQVLWAALGVIALMIMMRLPVETMQKIAPWLLLLALIVLFAVLVTPFGVSARGARRWLRLGPVTIQPSEFAKIALVLYMARFLAEKREQIRDWTKGFLPSVAIWGVFAVLVVLERDLGTIILMGTVMMGMWCLARMKVSHMATLGLASLPIIAFLVLQHSYRINRVLAFLDPQQYAQTHAFQLNQSLIAVGSGGWFGLGLGAGLQKYHFLSEAHTDFIFATVCEEIGFIGASCVILLFLALALTGFFISYRAPDYFSGLVAAGLTMTLVCAAFINFFVVLGMAPTKGLALPFFTYGGSSLLSSMMIVGILIAIANDTARSHGAD